MGWTNICEKKMNMMNNLKKLINEISLKKIDFYVISTNDENLLEYTPDQNNRLQWLTNFSGSNGIALISKKENFFFTDGRYILQAKKEIDSKFKIIDIQNESFFSFLQKNIKHKTMLIDYRIFNIKFVKELKRIAELNLELMEKNISVSTMFTTAPEAFSSKAIRSAPISKAQTLYGGPWRKEQKNVQFFAPSIWKIRLQHIHKH